MQPALSPSSIQVLRGAAAFAAVLAERPVSKSEHFAVYHRPAGKLSTSRGAGAQAAVDPADRGGPPGGVLVVGYVIPKRLARRAVTRVAIRRQMRVAVQRHGAGLAAGDWTLRLRAPFTAQDFRSASSELLQRALRAELDVLLQAAAERRPARAAHS
jgi:ribonuclease P protein component